MLKNDWKEKVFFPIRPSPWPYQENIDKQWQPKPNPKKQAKLRTGNSDGSPLPMTDVMATEPGQNGNLDKKWIKFSGNSRVNT